MQVTWLKYDFHNWLFNFIQQCLHFIMFTQIAISVNQGKDSVLMGIVMYFCEYYIHPGICLVRSIQHHKTEPRCMVYRIIELHQLVVNRQKIAENWTEVGSNNSNLINSQSTSIIAIYTQIMTTIFPTLGMLYCSHTLSINYFHTFHKRSKSVAKFQV